jgi:hypothetical protein
VTLTCAPRTWRRLDPASRRRSRDRPAATHVSWSPLLAVIQVPAGRVEVQPIGP